MWVSRRRLLDDLAAERARREELSRRVESQQTIITFLCARTNQLEVERALLLRQMTNLDIPTPQLRVTSAAASASVADAAATLDALTHMGIFDDDPTHAPAGWNPDGTVNYGGRTKGN